MPSNPRFLTPRMLADLIHINSGTLANWRSKGQGPKYHKIGRKVLYSSLDVEAWCRTCSVKTIDQRESIDSL